MLLAYLGALSYAPGDELPVHVSTDQDSWSASVVRLPLAPGQGGEALTSAGPVAGDLQEVALGSYGRVPNRAVLWPTAGAVTASAWICPTRPAGGREQGIVAKWSADGLRGFAVYLRPDGALALRLAGRGVTRDVATAGPLLGRNWYHVVATYRAGDGRFGLYAVAREPWLVESCCAEGTVGSLPVHPWDHDADVLIGALSGARAPADPRVSGHFNGKIADPMLLAAFVASAGEATALDLRDQMAARPADEQVGAWDFSLDWDGPLLRDRSRHECHGELVNMAARAMTGPGWTGAETDSRQAPEQYNAIHFHDDDLEDACWSTGARLTLPPGTTSGAYGVRVAAGHEEFWIPFFVRPARPSAAALFLAPTFTYLAYANDHSYVTVDYSNSRDRPGGVEQSRHDVFAASHPILGLSLYDLHSDGSGSCYSSARRPIYNLQPDYRSWLTGGPRHLAADMELLGWLDHRGCDYEVATDDDLHNEGVALLNQYRIVITGSHPEYWSLAMLQAMEQYLASGGRLMYLGGNGLYWVTSLDPARPHLIEVRRGHSGTRCWTSEPGEVRHSMTGEPGGLWRHRGWPPQRLLGVGFAAMGWGAGRGYRWSSDIPGEALDLVRGRLDPDEILGGFGLGLGGAAGDEIDRVDFRLGSPPGTHVLATSAGTHSDHYQNVVEDIESTAPGQGGTECAGVRADLALYTTSTGGAVFSAGSVNWCLSLSHNSYRNGVAEVSGNVLDAFCEEKLPLRHKYGA